LRNSTVARYAGPIKSERARLYLGIYTREEAEQEFRDAKEGWSKGSHYLCPFCDIDLYSPSGARKHMKTHDHPVLRIDWYEEFKRW
jgi:hypothetical protein